MIELRELTTIEEMEEVHQLETKIWETDIVPTHQTVTVVKNGGIMIGAYTDRKLIGFSYSFPGFKNNGMYLCSHMLGIDKDYRSRGIGEQLKWKQREIALAKGYERMHWTFDPLETRNAYLNLSKLHGICDTYVENCYGDMQDGLNKGLPSDRLGLHWHLNSPHVTDGTELELGEPVKLNAMEFNADGLPVFAAGHTDGLQASSYSLAVPKDFQYVKAACPELALDWRLQTRHVFGLVFQAGYAAVQLQVFENHAAYIFIKKEALGLGGNDA